MAKPSHERPVENTLHPRCVSVHRLARKGLSCRYMHSTGRFAEDPLVNACDAVGQPP